MSASLANHHGQSENSLSTWMSGVNARKRITKRADITSLRRNAVLQRKANQFGTAAKLQLFEDSIAMRIYRIHADIELACHILRRLAIRQKLEDFILARSQQIH